MPAEQKSLQLFGVGMQGKSPKVTSQRRVNCYYEFIKDGDRTKVAIYGTPGLETWATLTGTVWRGLIEYPKGSKFFGVFGNTFYEINSAGGTTSQGTLNTTSGQVYMAHNGTEVCITDGTDGWIYNVDTDTFTEITDVDFPTSPTSVIFHNGRFLVLKDNTGEFYASDLYDGLNWTAGQVATAEYSPDNLVRIVTVQGIVCLLGNTTAEFWSDTGSAGFPYARVPGAAMEWGLAARNSVSPFMDSFAFLARNRMGQVRLAMLNGLEAVPLSEPEWDSTVNAYTIVADATSYSYMLGGHPMCQINFPSAGKSWLYDGLTKVISELTSYGLTRHRGEIGSTYGNNYIVADYNNGKLYKLKPDVYTDAGDAITLELVGRHLFSNDKVIRIPALEIVLETGTATVGTDPQMAVAFSKDGGHSYGPERWVSIGQMGEYTQRARWRQNGRGRDIVVRARISEPMKKVIVGANWIANQGLS